MHAYNNIIVIYKFNWILENSRTVLVKFVNS